MQGKEINNGGFLKALPISNAFNYSKFVPHIKSAEERVLVETGLMSVDFYNDLINSVVNNISNYNDALGSVVEKYDSAGTAKQQAYEDLWTKYLHQLLSWEVLHMALPFIQVQIGDAGANFLEGNLQTSTGVAGAKYLQDVIRERVNRQQAAMRVWLCDNKTDFALFDTDDKLCEDCDDGNGFTAEDTLGIVFY